MELTKKEKDIIDTIFSIGIKTIANNLQFTDKGDNAIDISDKIRESKELHIKLMKIKTKSK